MARPSRLARAAALPLLIGFAGCSLLVSQDAAQCTSLADCARFPGTVCVSGGCVAHDAGIGALPDSSAPCSSTQDCEATHSTRFWVCRSSRCLSLTSGECGSVIGDYTADDVLLLGAILPIYGAHKSTGIALERALAFAADEDFQAGIPFGRADPDAGITKHPVALVLCDESTDAVRAATHLVGSLKVPAILGPARGSAFLAVANQVTVQNHVLLLSPYATADLAGLGGTGLVWRTAPSAQGEALAMAGLVERVLEPKLRADLGASSIAVALLYEDDADGNALHVPLRDALRFNGVPAAQNGARFTDLSFGDPNLPSDAPANAAVAEVLGLSPPPDLIVVDGSTRAVAEIVRAVETGWPPLAAPHPPYYLLSHGMLVAELLALVSSRPDLRKRILVTAPGDDARANKRLGELVIRYRGLYQDDPAETFGVAQTYDAFYLLAYALAAVRNMDVDGMDVSTGLGRVIGGPGAVPIDVGVSGIDRAFAALVGGSRVVLSGASGALAFDPNTGTAPSDVQTWCIVPGQSDADPTFATANLPFHAATATLDGALAPACLR